MAVEVEVAGVLAATPLRPVMDMEPPVAVEVAVEFDSSAGLCTLLDGPVDSEVGARGRLAKNMCFF